MKPLRSNVLIDTGELVDPSFVPRGTMIATPDICKRINNMGEIVSVGKNCKLIESSDIGKACLVRIEHHDDLRIRPRLSKSLGLKPTWHFIVDESAIHALIE